MATPDNQFEKILERLVDNLRDERCILLIGPEIAQIEGKSLIRYVNEKLLEESAEDILYYYQQDSIFLFRDDNAKLDAPRKLRRIYNDLKVDQEIYKKLLELPFPLIISLNPDSFLKEAAEGMTHNFRHFQFSGEAREEIPVPEKDQPLLYNLYGSIQEDESLVLDYEDLFRFLQIVIGPNGLPNKLRSKLREANSFLFLGFDFEKWYSQLMLQMLTGERRGRPKFAIKTNVGDEEARNFLFHQFKVEFLGSDKAFFDQFHARCATENLLRIVKPPVQLDAATLDAVKKSIAENNLENAFKILEQAVAHTPHADQTLALQGRYNNWKDQNLRGVLDSRDAEVLLNRIRDDIIQLTNALS